MVSFLNFFLKPWSWSFKLCHGKTETSKCNGWPCFEISMLCFLKNFFCGTTRFILNSTFIPFHDHWDFELWVNSGLWAKLCWRLIQSTYFPQLYGGIQRYLEQFPDGGFFRGKNFVFDHRYDHFISVFLSQSLLELLVSVIQHSYRCDYNFIITRKLFIQNICVAAFYLTNHKITYNAAPHVSTLSICRSLTRYLCVCVCICTYVRTRVCVCYKKCISPEIYLFPMSISIGGILNVLPYTFWSWQGFSWKFRFKNFGYLSSL